MFINVFGIVCQMKTRLPAAWTDAHKQKTWKWDGRWKRDEWMHVNDSPWNFHKKMQQPGLSQFFFNAKTDEFSTWLTRSPHFLERFPRSWFFREICSNCCCAPAIVCIADEPNKFQHWHHFKWFFNKDILQGRRTIAHLRALENRAFENHMVLSLLEFSLTKT